jgi:hypothetical protein
VQFDHDYELIIPTSHLTGVNMISFGGTAGVNIPAGNTAARPTSLSTGSFRLNTDTAVAGLEFYTGAAWLSPVCSIVAGTGVTVSRTGTAVTVNATGAGTVTSVGLSLPSIFTVTNSPVTSTGTLTATLASQTAKTFLAAPTAANGTPTFRTASITDMSDVLVSSPASSQVLTYNGTKWVNTGASASTSASGLIGVGQTGTAAWTLVSGSSYRADFTHNLGTTNVVISVFDSSTLALVTPDSVVCTNTNTVRVTVIGNTTTLKVVVVANGLTIQTGASVTVADEGTTIGNATNLNFTGTAVTVTDAGSGTMNIAITGGGSSSTARFSYFANSFDTPISTDYPIPVQAIAVPDPLRTSLIVRAFSNTTEQGVAFTCSIPAGATQMTIKSRGRADTAPSTASVVQPRLYFRQLPNNAAVGAWSSAYELVNINIPTNNYFQYSSQTLALSTVGLVADKIYQFEITRRVTGVTGTNLPYEFLLVELTIEFS